MLLVNDVTLRFGERVLFQDVNLKFENGNCYGVIGANGAGKTTFLKVLSRDLDPTSGEVTIGKHDRMSILKQNQNEFDDFNVLEVVIMGNSKLYNIMKEKDALYMKDPFTDEDGIRVGNLENEFALLNGWNAEADAAILLSGLGLDIELNSKLMKELTGEEKVKVLLAQAIFGEPDILLLDEPTNNLDIKAKLWLEEFLIEFPNTVIVVSHDRHFLNKVCTHTIDIDFESVRLFIGNYDFWYQSSQLLLEQMKESNKKKEAQMEELKDFIARFSANASKSKQATSRKKLLEKIELDEMKPSSRKYPFIKYNIDRTIGKECLTIEKLNIDGFIKNLNLIIAPGDKVAFIGNELAITRLFKALVKEEEYTGMIKWGGTVNYSYYPKNYDEFFKKDVTLFEWLQDFSEDKSESFVRGFLGRMLFSKDESQKKIKVLSGGEKARCMFSRMMLTGANTLIFDDPTNHLDIETITSLNKEMINFKGPILFFSHDHELLSTVANHIVEMKEDGTYIDKLTTYDRYIGIE